MAVLVLTQVFVYHILLGSGEQLGIGIPTACIAPTMDLQQQVHLVANLNPTALQYLR